MNSGHASYSGLLLRIHTPGFEPPTFRLKGGCPNHYAREETNLASEHLVMRVPAQYVSVTERHAERKLEHRNRGLNFTVPYLEIDASSEAELGPVNS